MEKYISKSALVAEIEKLQLCTMDEHMNYYSAEAQGEYNALSKLESFLNTLEVKEVDLEKEIKDYIYTLPHSRTGIPGGWKCSWPEEEVIKIVKHFLDLG